MAKKTWDEVIKNALNIYYHRDNYAYWYGIKGVVLTDEIMDYAINAYPEHFKRYTSAELKRYKDFSRGKVGFDCTGFVYACSGVGGSADGIFNGCPVKYGNSIDCVAGSMLHKKGHAGIDIGYGYFLHFPNEGHTCELGWSREYNWENACQLTDVDYTGADAR